MTQNAGTGLGFREHNVHIWKLTLDLEPEALENARRVLSPAELARAYRFVFLRDQHRFVAARGQLRSILANYLGIKATAVDFRYGPYGKPELDVRGTEPLLHFNLSHSCGLGIVGVTHGRRIGVDIEKLKDNGDADGIVKTCFAQLEINDYFALPVSQRVSAFYRMWTRKESYMKATGLGMTQSLSQFAVSVKANEPVQLRHHNADSSEPMRWTLRDLEIDSAFAAALAVEGPLVSVRISTSQDGL